MHRNVRIPATSGAGSADNSYLDLAPGGSLRVLVPILKSGGYRVAAESKQANQDTTVVLSADDLAGYEISNYSIEGKSTGKVRLRFVSATITRDGKALETKSEPALPFSLPAKPQRIRLIYLVRSSKADHNMAMAASRKLDALNRFTDRLKANPEICTHGGEIWCSWVPAGIAVRPE